MQVMTGDVKPTETYDRAQALAAQRKFCDSRQYPLFAPVRSCPKCNSDIWSAIPIEKAASSLITGCPFCHYSFVE